MFFFFCRLSGSKSQWSNRSRRDIQTFLSPDTSTTPPRGTQSQLGDKISPVYTWSTPGMGMHRSQEMSRWDPDQISEPPQLAPFNMDKQRFYSWVSKLNTLSVDFLSQPRCERNSTTSHFFGHYPELKTISACLVN